MRTLKTKESAIECMKHFYEKKTDNNIHNCLHFQYIPFIS